ncbi:MAG: tetratricopeptide repeat protein [Bacteroidota bacterium]
MLSFSPIQANSFAKQIKANSQVGDLKYLDGDQRIPRSHPYSLLITTLLCGILLISGFSSLKADQYAYRDSLRALLTTQLSDLDRYDVLRKLHSTYLREQPDSGLYYLQKALAFSQEIENTSCQINAYLSLAYFYFWIKGLPAEAKLYLHLARPLIDERTKPRYVSAYYDYSGIIHMNIGIYDTAAAHFLIARARYEEREKEQEVMGCINNLGTVYNRMGKYDQALKYYLEYLEKAESIAHQDGKESLGLGLGNVGLIYKKQKDYPQAIQYLQRSLEINKELGDLRNIVINYQNIGSTYESMVKLDSAEYFYSQALKLAEELNLPAKILYAKHGLGFVYGSQQHYAKAFPLLEEALTRATELDLRDLISGINYSLSLFYERAGNPSQALHYRIEYEIWKDSMINENYLNRIKELELKYETAKKEKEINNLTQQAQIQELTAKRQTILSWALGIGFLLLLIIVILIVYQARQRLRNQQMIATQQQELDASHFQQKLGELEMKALRAQMNPHFVFNCLNSINHLTLKGETQQASRYLSKFSKLLRQILEHSEKDLVSLAEELSMLNTYVQLEALRFRDKIQVEQIIDPETDVDDVLIPPLILQPIVENAIWHGLMHKEGEGNIWIFVKEEPEMLSCVIEDDGIGREKAVLFRPDSSPKQKSFGLQLTRERLLLLTQKDRLEGELTISERQGGGTRVDIRIPIS